jgi:hypothetical protein
MIMFVAGFLAGSLIMAIIAYLLNEFDQPAHRANRSRPAFRAEPKPRMIPVTEVVEVVNTSDPVSDEITVPVNVVPFRRLSSSGDYRPRHARDEEPG